MASFMSDAELHAFLDARASGGPDRQVGLSLTVPVVSGGVLVVTEPDGASYARVSLPAADWAAASARQVTTAGPVVFADPLEDWGVVVGYFLTDGSGQPAIGFKVGGEEAYNVVAGSTDVNVRPRISE